MSEIPIYGFMYKVSIITKSLEPFINHYKSNNVEMTGLCDSYEIKFHYADFLRCYKTTAIPKLLNYFNVNLDKIKCFYDLILYYEVESTYLFDRKNALFEVESNYKDNIHIYDDKLKDYLLNKNYPIIKLKKLDMVHYDKFPENFNASIYKQLHNDLSHFTDIQATEHFIKSGMKEGRKYKFNQTSKLPEYLLEYINNNNLNFILTS